MKISQLLVMGILTVTVGTAQRANAAISQCNKNFCQLPTIDCGPNGEFSDKLRTALTTRPKDALGNDFFDDNRNLIAVTSLIVTFTGTCVGPFIIGPDVFGRTIAKNINLNGEASTDPASGEGPATIVSPRNPDGSPVLPGPGVVSQALIVASATVNVAGITFKNGGGGPGVINIGGLDYALNGGSIANFGSLSVSNSIFDSNTARNATFGTTFIAGGGGAIFNSRPFGPNGPQGCNGTDPSGNFDCKTSGTMAISYTKFINNDTQGGHGAAIFNNGGPYVAGNKTADSQGLRIEHSAFSGNGTNAASVVANASIPNFAKGTIIINASAFSDAIQRFPALIEVYNGTGDIFITNSTIAELSSQGFGWGISNQSGTVGLTYSTVVNKAVGVLSAGATVNFFDSIIFGNHGNDCIGSGFNSDGSTFTDITTAVVNDVVVFTNPCGPDLDHPHRASAAQMALGEFADYGGGTTAVPLPVVPLNPGSAALFSGDPDTCKVSNDLVKVAGTDQRGRTRPQEPPTNPPLTDPLQGARALLKWCDSGAYELQTNTITFNGLFTRIYGDPPFLITTSLDSNPTGDQALQSVTYISLTPAVCTVSGMTATILAAGDCTIQAATPDLVALVLNTPPSRPSFFGNIATKTYTILQASLTITGPTATMTYGGTVPLLVPTYVGLKYGATQPATPPTCVADFTALTPVAGSPYTTTCSGAVDPNYIITYVPGQFIVNPAPITITASSGGTMTFGSNLPLVVTPTSFSGFVNGQDPSVFLNAAGVSTVFCGFVDKNNNNQITAFSNTTPAGTYQTACTGTAANYVVTPPPSNCVFPSADPACTFAVVLPAGLNITASSATMIYGDAPPVITPTYTGFINDQNAPATLPTCTTNATSSSHVSGNPYVSTCSGAADPNYTITYTPGVVTILPAPLTITASSAFQPFGTVPKITPIYTGFKNNDTATSLTTQPVCSTNTVGLSPISGNPYISSCTGAVDPDYVFTYVPGVVTVQIGMLNVVASSPTINFGEPIPAITPIYIGLGVVPPSAVLTPTCVTTATALSEPGTYPTSCSGAVLANFIITYTDGVLTINKDPTTLVVTTVPMPLSAEGSAVQVTVQVESHFGTPTGEVDVSARSGESCKALLDNGTATCILTFATRNLETISASYVGDNHFNPGTSPDVFLGITQAAAPEVQPVAALPGCDSTGEGGSAGNLLPLAFAFMFLAARRAFRKPAK